MTRQQIKLTEVKALQKKAKTLLLESRMRPKVHVRFAGGGSEKGYRDTTRKFKLLAALQRKFYCCQTGRR